jgi:tetratricopeptide (TPR) repeat protein/transcriptional regulator with XRE-family HTH domain
MEATPSPAFGTLLRRYRRAAGLTQEQLAEHAALSLRSISDLERGVPHVPRKETVALLAEALALAPPDSRAFTAAAHRLAAPAPAIATLPSVATPQFVGRTRELATLERHLAGEGPPVLLLAGEPGIGKTRLLRTALPRAVAQGWCVLEGGCQRSGGQPPYAPLPAAMQRYIRGRRSSQLRADLQGCAWLVRLLPELTEGPIPPLPTWTLPPVQERRLMMEAVLRFLANLAGPAGTLLVLDDLQWAGPDGLHLMLHLAESAGEVPLRIVGAYRDTEVQAGDPLAGALADLMQAGLLVRSRIGPLAQEEAAQLLDTLVATDREDTGSALRERVLSRTGGVPFFLVSCAQSLRQHAEEAEGKEALPWDVAHSISRRVSMVLPGGWEVLGVAAVIGRVVPRALLTLVARRPEDDLLTIVDALCRARLLEEHGPEAYQFAHDLIREVIAADLGAGRRAVLHRRVAEALELQPDPPVELLAYHFGRSGEHEKVARYLEQAGDKAAALFAYAAAQTHYQAVVDLLDRLGRGRQAAPVLAKLGAVLKTMGQYEQALRILERAAATHREAYELEAEGRVTALIGQIHFAAGTWEAGIARIRPLIATLEARGPSPALAALDVALIPLFAPTGRYREYLAVAERASALARHLEDGLLLADSEAWRGVALAELDRQVDARPVLEGAVRLAEAVHHLGSLGRALAFLGGIYLKDGALARARAVREQALDVYERWGDPHAIGWTVCCLADVHILAGTWPQARTLYERADTLFHSLGGATRFSSLPLVGLGALALKEGNWEDASCYLEEGYAVAGRTSHLGALHRVQAILAEKEMREGCPGAALTRLRSVFQDRTLEESVLTKPIPILAEVYLELGRIADAEKLVAQGITRARNKHDLIGLVEWLRLQGMTQTRQGQWQEAQQILDEAAALAGTMPYPYEEARSRRELGNLHVQMGDWARAHASLEEALAIFQRLGARPDVEQTEKAIRELGSGRQNIESAAGPADGC